MSTDEKSEDKKEIEDEEREKMLNEENKRESSEVPAQQADKEAPKGEVEKMKKALEESEKEKEGKKKIPIGGIRMPGIPGFLRSRSREKNNKDGESEHEEDKDLLHDAPSGTPGTDRDSVNTGQDQTPPSKRLSLKISNPFKKGKQEPSPDQAGTSDSTSKSKRFLDAIQLPLVSFFPPKSKGPKETEIGAAGLASMETLDDKSGADPVDDGMESVKLDVEEKDEKGDDGNNKQDWQERLRLLSKHRVIAGGVVIFIILLIIIIVIAASGPSPPPYSASSGSGRYIDTITSCGPVQGLVEDGAFVFRGIPYAAPPVDERRWLKAQPIQKLNDCWEGTFLAYNTTPICWQLFPDGSMDGSEDCLTLDVYTPRIDYHSPLPVVVLIGAETLLGGSPGDLVPSAKLAKEHEVVFVRPNFRMGVLGFLASDVLSKSTHPPTSGNYGLSDILAALKWVNLNIVNFNGDKNSVTVLGHRAGATLVTALTTSRLSHGFFNRAWLSSGSGVYPGKLLQESEMKNAKYVKNIEQCKDNITAECLRTVDPEDLIKAIPHSWKPVISDLPMPSEEPAHEWLVLDGEILQRHPFEVFSNGSLPFKIIIGTTAHAEASPELYRRYEDLMAVGEEAVASHIRSSVLGKNLTIAEEAIRRYGTTWPGLASMVSDIRTVCPLLSMSRQFQNTESTFYVATEPRGPQRIADVHADAEVFMRRYKHMSTEERRFNSAMEKLFYRFVYFDEIRKEVEPNTVLLIGQDTNPSIKYPNCDLWFMYDIVPRYARVD